MIEIRTTSIMDTNCTALINTVNTVGVMGKGLALAVKEEYPDNFRIYSGACIDGILSKGGDILVVPVEDYDVKYIINFATKEDWRDKSKLDYIERGMDTLVKEVLDRSIRSVAIPKLGSSNGGLHWDTVKAIILSKIIPIDSVHWVIYE